MGKELEEEEEEEEWGDHSKAIEHIFCKIIEENFLRHLIF